MGNFIFTITLQNLFDIIFTKQYFYQVFPSTGLFCSSPSELLILSLIICYMQNIMLDTFEYGKSHCLYISKASKLVRKSENVENLYLYFTVSLCTIYLPISSSPLQ